jgi:hypothetical protein
MNDVAKEIASEVKEVAKEIASEKKSLLSRRLK